MIRLIQGQITSKPSKGPHQAVMSSNPRVIQPRLGRVAVAYVAVPPCVNDGKGLSAFP
jgi:hypothetical protein